MDGCWIDVPEVILSGVKKTFNKTPRKFSYPKLRSALMLYAREVVPKLGRNDIYFYYHDKIEGKLVTNERVYQAFKQRPPYGVFINDNYIFLDLLCYYAGYGKPWEAVLKDDLKIKESTLIIKREIPQSTDILRNIEKEIFILKQQSNKHLRNELQIYELTETNISLKNELQKKENYSKNQEKIIAELEQDLSTAKNKNNLKQEALQALRAREFKKAEQYLNESAASRIEEVSDDFFQLGKIYELQELYKEALVKYELAVKISPSNPSYLMSCGDTYLHLNNIEDALKYYNLAIIQAKKKNDRKLLSILYSSISHIHFLFNGLRRINYNLSSFNIATPDVSKNINVVAEITNYSSSFTDVLQYSYPHHNYYHNLFRFSVYTRQQKKPDVPKDYTDQDRNDDDKLLTSIECYKQLMVLEKKNTNYTTVLFVHLSIVIEQLRNKKTALEYFKTLIIGYIKQYDLDEESLACIHNAYGILLLNNKYFNQAIQEFGTAIRYMERTAILNEKKSRKDSYSMCNFLSALFNLNLGVCYLFNAEFENAKKSISYALSFIQNAYNFKEGNYSNFIKSAKSALGVIYILQNKSKMAAKYFKEADGISTLNKDDNHSFRLKAASFSVNYRPPHKANAR